MTTPSISVQLYSVREALEADLDAALARLAVTGFRHVEAFDFVRRAAPLRAALDRHGLSAPTAHAVLASSELPSRGGAPVPAPSLAQTLDAAAELGVGLVIDPFVPAERWTTEAGVRETAERLNAAAAEAGARGLAVGYHNHDHELRPRFGDRTALELLAEHLDEAVRLEVDLYWAAAAGVDVVELLGALGPRVAAVHVKDGTLSHEVRAERGAPTGQVPAGQGDVPLDAALDAARWAEHAVVEFDAVEGDLDDAIAASFAYLSARGLR